MFECRVFAWPHAEPFTCDFSIFNQYYKGNLAYEDKRLAHRNAKCVNKSFTQTFDYTFIAH